MKKKTLIKLFSILLFVAIVLDGISTDVSAVFPGIAIITNTIWAIVEAGLAVGLVINIRR